MRMGPKIVVAMFLLIVWSLGSELARADDGIWQAASGKSIWHPAPGNSFDWQLTEPFDLRQPAEIPDLDLFDTPPGVIADLKRQGVRLICYINIGAWEEWRPDAGDFPDAVLGKGYDGWAGERWLDIRALDALAPLIRARMDLCRDKGFDGIEPDNIDGYDNATGFAIRRADQIRYNLWLAAEAHQRGLSIALKNAPQLLEDLAENYDWALLEDCHAQGWCNDLAPFVEAGKAVIAVEYTDQDPDWPEICQQAADAGVQTLLKTRDLTGWSMRCK